MTFIIDHHGAAKWTAPFQSPSQHQLSTFITANRPRLTALHIVLQGCDNADPLDFTSVGTLPALTTLQLHCLTLSKLYFTRANTPELQNLDLQTLDGPNESGLSLEFDLPQLRALNLSYVNIEGECDFGMSLTRCPKLQVVHCHKLFFLEGDNFCVLPECESFTLIRSDGTFRLEILSAPRLTELSVQNCYELEHLRIWDLPYELGAEDVERLQKDTEKEVDRVVNDMQQLVNGLKNGKIGGEQAFARGLIHREDVANFDFENDRLQNKLLFRANVALQKNIDDSREQVWKSFVDGLGVRPKKFNKDFLPSCAVNRINVSFTADTVAHLKDNRRVVLTGGDGRDPEM